jgi:hypothetical protein
LEVDPEGNGSCLLTLKDGIEFSEILTELSGVIWNRNEEKPVYEQSFRKTTDWSWEWDTPSGILVVIGQMNTKNIEILLNNNTSCFLTVNQTVEVIQIIQQLCKFLNSVPKEVKRKWWQLW